MENIDLLSREECIDRWTRLHGKRPPKYTSMHFMKQALAYEAQVKKFGGHSRAVKRVLKLVVAPVAESVLTNDAAKADRTNSAALGTSALSLRAGMHLVREWNGRTYQVEVLEKGFLLDGKTYRSLSAIARKITGAHWSGPRFFGLMS